MTDPSWFPSAIMQTTGAIIGIYADMLYQHPFIAAILTILVLITASFYSVTKQALYNMSIAFLNCEIFWNFGADKSKKETGDKAGRLLRHANWWRLLYEKNCSVVIFCFFSDLLMLLAIFSHPKNSFFSFCWFLHFYL